MPRGAKKKKDFDGRTSDFTLDDYADARVPRSRPTKRDGEMSRRLATTTTTVEDRNWDDDVDEELDLVEDVDDEGNRTVVVRAVASGAARRYLDDSTGGGEERGAEDAGAGGGGGGGVEYPIDVWFQISRRVRPEDVGRFAGICRATLSVTRTANFWFHLYRKYLKRGTTFPPGLEPERMALRYGLRSCVIRFLHHTYAPFSFRENASNFYTPKTLLKRRCLTMWYEKPADRWFFFFKLKLVDRGGASRQQSAVTKTKRSVFNILDDIMANPESDCKILRIQCANFSNFQPVMGMILNEIFTKVASNMRYNNLNLGFSQGLHQSGPKLQECTIVFNHVFKMEVLDWWHPDYPHSTEFLPSSVLSNCTKTVNFEL